MKKILIITLVLLLVTVSIAFAWGKECPVCEGNMYRTGQSTVEYGKILYEYRCVLGHTYWFPSGWSW